MELEKLGHSYSSLDSTVRRKTLSLSSHGVKDNVSSPVKDIIANTTLDIDKVSIGIEAQKMQETTDKDINDILHKVRFGLENEHQQVQNKSEMKDNLPTNLDLLRDILTMAGESIQGEDVAPMHHALDDQDDVSHFLKKVRSDLAGQSQHGEGGSSSISSSDDAQALLNFLGRG